MNLRSIKFPILYKIQITQQDHKHNIYIVYKTDKIYDIGLFS